MTGELTLRYFCILKYYGKKNKGGVRDWRKRIFPKAKMTYGDANFQNAVIYV